ncbi:MAG TPA: hypothetical protein VIG29_20650 [Vicinamibacteria bacterium]
MAHCWFCGKVKGKRSCPARGGSLICSRCCGANRVVSIRCPPDCVYLHGTHDPKWSSESREKESARFFARALALEESPAQFYLFLHFVLALTRNPLGELDDSELAEVAAAAASTLETRAKGVLYSHPPERLHLGPAAAWLTRLVAARDKMPEAPNVSDEDSAVALRALAEGVGEHIREGGRERYLSKLKRLFTKAGGGEKPLTLPEGLDEPPKSLIVAP